MVEQGIKLNGASSKMDRQGMDFSLVLAQKWVGKCTFLIKGMEKSGLGLPCKTCSSADTCLIRKY